MIASTRLGRQNRGIRYRRAVIAKNSTRQAVDDWRASEGWRFVHGKLAFAVAGSRTESLIPWRRIAGGMTADQQQQLITPLLAPLNTVIAAQPVTPLLDSLIKADSPEPLRQLAVMQIAQKTDDRYRDIDPNHRAKIVRWLKETHAPERMVQAVEIGGGTSTEDAAAIFGESLPLGIRLK
jgi:hypothetical protein